MQKMRCPVKRIDKKYRFQILMRLSAADDEIMQRIYEICDKNEKKVTVFAEVNPQNRVDVKNGVINALRRY